MIATDTPQLKPGKKSCRILVVEDNADVARALTISLERSLHDVQSARNGTEGLVVAAQFRPHVVIIDIGLPGLDGHYVARQLRNTQPHLLIIAATGRGTPEDHTRSREAGIDHHLVKPLDFQLVHQLLDDWHRQGGCDS